MDKIKKKKNIILQSRINHKICTFTIECTLHLQNIIPSDVIKWLILMSRPSS